MQGLVANELRHKNDVIITLLLLAIAACVGFSI